MFFKKDMITQNNKPFFIGMLVIIVLFMVLTVFKDNSNKKKLEQMEAQALKQLEEQKAKITPGPFSGNPFAQNAFVKPELSPKDEKDPEKILNKVLEKFSDKKKLLFFYASWNRDSYYMMEDVKNLAVKYKDSLKVIVVEIESSVPENSNFDPNSGMERILATDAKIPATYMVDAVPSVVMLGPNQAKSPLMRGKLSLEELEKLLQE